MRSTTFIVLLSLILSGPASAAELPATPVGTAFAEWLDLLERADDDAAVRTFLETRLTPRFFAIAPVEQHTAIFQQIAAELAGLEPAIVEPSTDADLVALFETPSRDWLRVRMTVEEAPPHRIDRLGVRETEPPGSAPTAAATDEELVLAVRAYVDSIAAEGRFSGTVLIARDGATLFEGAWGVAHRRYDVPNRIDTRFNLGSANKMFTAVAIAQLVEAGALDWDDLVGRHLPDYPNERVRNEVTIAHLLSHRSGMGSHFTDAFMDASKLQFREPADYRKLFQDEPLAFDPGSQFAYSNAGFFVLGSIIETVTGASYFDVVRTRIYRPAGMLASDSYESDGTDRNIAMGYYEDEGILRENTLLHSVKGTPAGGGYSTVGDLNRFANALLEGRLIATESLDRMTAWTSDRGSRDGARRGYGLGFSLHETADGLRSFGHGGGFPGINAKLAIYPERGYTVVALTNMDGAAEKVAVRIRGMFPAP